MQTEGRNAPYDITNPHIAKYIRDLTHPVKQWLFLFMKLPSALFMGVRVLSVSPEKAVVSVPYSWRSQNPFKSTYFAAQAAAAEMSTGVLGMMALQGRGSISVLVSDIRGEFLKKATSRAYFTCVDGQKICAAVQKAIETGEGVSVNAESIGMTKDGTVVSKFYVSWTFKVRQK
jgi:acyl-coenzyme A thioesterase PaaI-like protein